MKLEEYIKESARTDHPTFHLDKVRNQTVHGIMGLATEAGECLDALKKSMFYGTDFDLVNLKEEVGDVMWYVAQICRSEGWDLEEVMQENIDKLKLRYPHNWNQQDAIKRADKEVG